MQTTRELVDLITAGRPDVTEAQATEWAYYLSQLSGCHLYSVTSPEVDKEEWLRHRQAGIGGSEISVLIGANEYQSPNQLWKSKVVPITEDGGQSEAARWGNVLETVVVDEWAKRNNRQWIHIPVILQSDEHSWLLANIDAFALTDDRSTITALIEVKTTNEYNKEAWDIGPLPYNYICQITWYMGCTSLPITELICLVGGQKLYHHTIPIDQDLFKQEKEAAEKFWNENVLAMVEPPLGSTDLERVKDMPRDESAPTIIITDVGAQNLAEAYCELREKISTLEKVKNALNAQLYNLMGTNTKAVVGGRNITISYSERQKCDFEALKALYPDVYNKVITINRSATLRIT